MTIQQHAADPTQVLSISGSCEVPVPVASIVGARDQAGREVIPGYRLIEPIGAGGYGEVWRAEAPGGLAKAVKLVYGQSGEKRALDERKSLLRIKDVRHPFLLSLERIEVVDNQLIVVTELADSSLKDRFEACVASGRPGIPRAELLRYLAEAADVLDYMTSEHGLQHLDIKPENLLLVGGHMKVADFGLVKSVHDVSASIVGGLTPMFAAPETFDGRPSDRSDQYSLAIVYQLLLTGRCPFNGQTLAQLASQHLNGRPDLSALPESDRQFIERALSKDPFDRFPNCRTLLERLAGNGGQSPFMFRGTESPPVTRRTTPAVQLEPTNRNDFKTEVIDVKLAPQGSATNNSETQRIPACSQATAIDLPVVQLTEVGELRPTLIIGVGGCGAKVLRSLVEILPQRLAPLADLPALRMLLIDTDYESYCAEFGRSSQVTLDERQFVHTPLKPTQYYRTRRDDLTNWLSRRWIYNIPKQLKTEGIRPLGRLAFVDHVRQIERRVTEELAEICSEPAVTTTSQTLGRPVNSAVPRVYLIGSISSGTGGGMVWDIAQLVYQALRQRDVQPAEIIGLLAHWSCSTATEKELALVNACSSLRELQHYAIEGCPGDVSCQLPPLGRHHGLFDNMYVVDSGTHSSESGFQNAAQTIAEYLAADTSPPGEAFTNVCRRPHPSADRMVASLRTFGCGRIEGADLLTVEQAARELVLQAAEPVEGNDDPLVSELVQVFEQEDTERNGELKTLLAASPADVPAAAKRTLALARRRLLDLLVEQKLRNLHPTLLGCGGSRRFLIVTSVEMQRAGLVDMVQKKLPAAATIAMHDKDELVVLCEGAGVPIREAALSIIRDRPELLDLAARMPTRCDVPWTTLP